MPPSRSIGALIGNRYEVVGYLGGGTFGEVYSVIDRHQNDRVALKLLGTLAGTSVWDEAQILTRLRGPYIVDVRNADIDAGVPYVVTELARHGSADTAMDPIGVPPAQAVRWARQACRGTSRTHAENLVHRDIKPGNLFLTAAGEARLGDFGIAALMDANGRASAGGTIVTMAPEVAAGGPTTVASDVYSLGATLYALLAGRYAHQLPDPLACRNSVINDPPPPLRDFAPHVSLALGQRVAKAMERAPTDRYATPADFDAALGTMPEPIRRWRRTDEHTGHDACWRGEARGRTDVTVCLVPVGTRWEVLTLHQPNGRRINAACRPPAPRSAVPRNVRAAIAAAS